MNKHTKPTRVGRLLAALVLPVLFGACDSLLDVDNPAVIQEGDLTDPKLVPFMVNGVVGQFQETFTSQALYSGILSDELIDGHTYLPHKPHDRRELTPAEEYVRIRYRSVHQARGTADSLSVRIEKLLGDQAGTSVDLARTLAYAGYTYVMLGEQFCGSPINAGKVLSEAELLGIATRRFERAIGIATAAGAADAKRAASADSIANLARVGAARAYLQLGNQAKAIEFARQVPAGFQFWIAHSENSGAETNDFYAAAPNYNPKSTGTRWIALDPAFEGLNDRRIPHTDVPMNIMDTREMFIPYQPLNFSGWTGKAKVPFTKSAHIRFASGLEAQYIVAEAGGMSAAELRAFLDARRAVGGQPAFAGTDEGLQAELRDQRRRDFFLTNHRLGDLRRYKAQQGIDLFPSGTYPQTSDSYGSAECYPVSSDELNSNPNAQG